MSVINLDQFRSIKRENSAPSFGCFVKNVYDQNSAAFEAAWLEHAKKHVALAKSTNNLEFIRVLKPYSWHEAEWACSKITITLNAAVSFFEFYNHAVSNSADMKYYKDRAEALLNTFDELLTQLESFEYKYHYHNAVAVSQLVIDTLKQIK